MSNLRWLVAAFFALAVLPTTALTQERGTITGQVTEAQTLRPLAGVQVSIGGTTLGTITNAQGRFLIPNVPVGTREVRVSLIGYGVQTRTVNVIAGETATANFELAQTAIALDEVVVTGTAGRQERRAQAAVIATVPAASIVETAPVTTVADILQARTPGVSLMQNSGSSGTGQNIRIRGAASLTLSNEPLVFIDGVRMDSRLTQTWGVGGQVQSRLNDIRPEDIESIEVVKGPAAATLYGADASAGVIQIITKRGRPGAGFTQSVTAEYNAIDQGWTPPDNWGVCTAALVAETSTNPLCRGREVGTPVSDNPLVRYNVFRTGQHRSINWSGRGGGENYGFYVSLGTDLEEGTLPGNEYNRYSGRFNFNFIPTPRMRVEAGLGLIRTEADLPHNDNNIYGYLGGGMLGSPLTVRDPVLGGDARDGWFAGNRQVDAISAIDNMDVTWRITPTFTFNYSPVEWFTNRLNVGGDMTRGENQQFWPRNPFGWYGTAQLNSGQIGQGRLNRDQWTLDYMGNIARPLTEGVSSDISFGTQIMARRTDLTWAQGITLTTNAANAVNAAAQQTGGQSFSEERQVGFFGQWQVGYQDRLFVQLAGRVDQASAFGAEAPPFFSPKVGVSYVISDEPFWQDRLGGIFPSMRLRSAYGTTGRSPATGAIATFGPSPFAVTATDVGAGVIPQNPGNPELRPERGTEFEAGFDMGILGERIGLEVSYFNKVTNDIILARPQPPSRGFTQNPLVNIGQMVNSGIEVGANARILDLPNFRWETRLGFNTLHNAVTDLGDVEPFGSMYRTVEGLQPGSFHVRTIREVVTDPARAAEVCRPGQTVCAIVADSLEFYGNFLPTFEGSFSNTLTLMQSLRLTGQLDWKSNYYIYNNSDQFRERQFGTGERWVRRNEILTEEERIRRFGPFVNEVPLPGQTYGGAVPSGAVNEEYIERGDFIRLREVALTYTLPPALAQTFGGRSASITLAGRNLALWTEYTGADPEIDGLPTDDFARWDFLTLPPPTRWVARVNFQF